MKSFSEESTEWLTVLSRSYNLYSDVQRADDIVVVLPAEAGENISALRNV
ncbi:DUF961 family protein [Staphylococcus aureus]